MEGGDEQTNSINNGHHVIFYDIKTEDVATQAKVYLDQKKYRGCLIPETEIATRQSELDNARYVIVTVPSKPRQSQSMLSPLCFGSRSARDRYRYLEKLNYDQIHCIILLYSEKEDITQIADFIHRSVVCYEVRLNGDGWEDTLRKHLIKGWYKLHYSL